MPSRGGLVLLSAATVLASAVLLVAGPERGPVGQVHVEIAAALNEGRTDDSLLALATQAATDAAQGSDRISEASALEDLGRVHAARGEYPLAEKDFVSAAALRQVSGDSAALASALEQLADVQIRAGAFDAGTATVAQLRSLRDDGPRDAVGDARLLELDATIQNRRGRYAAARQTLDQAFSLVAPDGLPAPRLAAMRFLSGDLAFLMGDLERARSEYDSALEIARRNYGDTHPSIVPYLGRVAVARVAFGDMGPARDLRLTAKEIADRSLPPCHPESIAALNDLALSDMFFGDFAGARQASERALQSSRQCLGPTHSLTAQMLGNVGLIVSELGDLSDAERYERDAVSAWTAARGATHPFVALALEQLAQVVAASGRTDEALDIYQQAMQIRVAALGDSHPTVARLLTLRAGVLAQQKKLAAAIRDLDRAAAIYEKGTVGDEPDVESRAQMELLRGDVERALGRGEQARQAYAAALSMREGLWGPSHPLVADARTLMAVVDAQQGASRDAFEEAINAEAMSRDHFRRTIRYLTERQALEFASLKPKALDLAITLAGSTGDDRVRSAFDALIQSRGVVLDELAARAQLVHRDPAVAADLMKRLVSSRERYANLIVQSLRETVPRERIDAARREAEAAEELVAQQSASVRAEQARADAGFDKVLAALPAKAVLAAFVRYEPPTLAGRPSAPMYGLFVVGKDSGVPAFVRIGEVTRIESLVRAWRTTVGTPPVQGGSMLAAGTALRRAIWDPIARRAGDATRVFIVPDGALNVVNFSALPRTGGGYLVEDARVVHYLSTERDLLVAPERPSPSALVVGGPAFTGSRAVATVASLRAGGDCRGASPLSFSDLPAARQEAAEVSSLWSKNGAGEVVTLSGADATETAVKAALSNRRVVHLATHGFFVGRDCQPAAPRTRAVGGIVAANAPPTPIIRNPLLLSGLALAEASRRQPDSSDDGILTAEEIASLDLHGTEWAVLSACDTGLGEIRSGEGVLGLRRAFQIAGARTVIMSLWSVDDQATRKWMQALYEARLTRGLDTAESTRAASIAMLEQRRAAHLSTHPFYWGAFVAAGDWR